MTYQDALHYIHSIHWRGSRPGLSRTEALLKALGNPEKALRCIHIAGTNGKGSTSAMLDSILRRAGYRVGLFTSPYVERFNERIVYNGEPIADDVLSELVERLMPIAEALPDKPTEFELITALGFCFFAQMGCDVVVLEVGMGGRLDSTNVIEKPLLSVITGIALDHTAFLGDTLEKIAAEKAGIIKEGCPVLYGGDTPSVSEVIEARAKALGSPYYRTDRTDLLLKKADLDGSVVDYDGFYDLFLPLRGLYQSRNLATVITAVRLLRGRGLALSDEAIREGLAATHWKARFEVLSRDPLFVFDGSHNKQGIAAACEAMAHYFKGEKVILVSGVMADKDYTDMVEMLLPFAARVFTVTPDNPRALAAKDYAACFLKQGADVEGCESIMLAVEKALKAAAAEKRPIVALGSLYMYHDVKKALFSARSSV